MKPLARVALAATLLASPAQGATQCPLSQAVLTPVGAVGEHLLDVSRDGDGYRFRLTSKASGQSLSFAGSYQNGSGHLNLIEERPEDDGEPLMSRAVFFRADLMTADPWNRAPVLVAYAYFETLAEKLWDRARANAQDDKPGAFPPDGLWRVASCRPAPGKGAR